MIVTGSCLEATHAFSVSSSALASALTAVSPFLLSGSQHFGEDAFLEFFDFALWKD